MTSLLLAIVNGHADLVRVLLENGASLDAVDKVNMFAYALANKCFIR
jgi:ankyrin repeat protein